jgi:Histidine kinase-like ATPase domain
MLAAEMAGLAGDWPPSPDPAATGRACRPRIATLTAGADAGSVRTARDFTVAVLRRWGVAQLSPDIAIVVSELMTNALRHALPASGDTRPRRRRPIRLGLLQPGPCVLCAVADPSKTAPALRTPGSLAETGRGLHIICALSDQRGLHYAERCRKGRVGPVPPAADAAVRGPVPAPTGPRPVAEPGNLAELASVNHRSPADRGINIGRSLVTLKSTGHVWITI